MAQGHLMCEPEPMHVLLVEDNIINQKILAKSLRQAGCVVETADNGLEGVNYVRQSIFAALPILTSSTSTIGTASDSQLDRVDSGTTSLVLPKPLSAILMDIEMPVMNGLEATSKIREMQSDGCLIGHVPIIAITANARREHVQKAYDAGMDDVQIKPFKISGILEKIKDTIARLGEAGLGVTETGMAPL